MNKEIEDQNQISCEVYNALHLIPADEAKKISSCLQKAWESSEGDQIYPYVPFLDPHQLSEPGGEIYEHIRNGDIHMAVVHEREDVAAIASLVRKEGRIPELGRVAANPKYLGNGHATKAAVACLNIAKNIDHLPVFIGISANRSIMESVLVKAAEQSDHRLAVVGLSPNCYRMQGEVSGNVYEWSEVDWIAFHEPLLAIPITEEVPDIVEKMIYHLVLRSKGALQIEGAEPMDNPGDYSPIGDSLIFANVKNVDYLGNLLKQKYYPVGVFPLVHKDGQLEWHVKMYRGDLPKLYFERQGAIAPGQSPVYSSRPESYRAMSLILEGNSI